jgi:hypothetical protein
MKPMVLATLSVIAIITLPVGAAPATEPIVRVRTYNYARVSDEELAGARGEAARIFREAGIGLEWIACRVPGSTSGASCTQQLVEGRDFMLRLREDSNPETNPAAGIRTLGVSILDREQRTGVLMTLDVVPIRTISQRSSTEMAMLLGRAIAHEAGHLLLGHTEHSFNGLMRAFWSHDELRGARVASWGFSPREGAQMRENLRGRPCLARVSTADCKRAAGHPSVGN